MQPCGGDERGTQQGEELLGAISPGVDGHRAVGEVAHVQSAARRKGMVGRGDADERVVEEGLDGDLVRVGAGIHESDVGGAVGEQANDVLAVRVVTGNLEVQGGEAVKDQGHERWGEGGVHDGPHPPARVVGAHRRDGLLDERKAALRVGQETVATWGQGDPAPGPGEQGCAQVALEAGDALADGGLGAVQADGAAADAARRGDGEEGAEVVEVDSHRRSLSLVPVSECPFPMLVRWDSISACSTGTGSPPTGQPWPRSTSSSGVPSPR
jgi:hypothetical protein